MPAYSGGMDSRSMAAAVMPVAGMKRPDASKKMGKAPDWSGRMTSRCSSRILPVWSSLAAVDARTSMGRQQGWLRCRRVSDVLDLRNAEPVTPNCFPRPLGLAGCVLVLALAADADDRDGRLAAHFRRTRHANKVLRRRR